MVVVEEKRRRGGEARAPLIFGRGPSTFFAYASSSALLSRTSLNPLLSSSTL